MGNTCRSPLAKAVLLRKLAENTMLLSVQVDSAGTHPHPANSPPDARAQKHATLRGYDLTGHRSRALVEADFETFDLLLTMDWENRALLEERCPTKLIHKIRGLSEFLQTSQVNSIPDPLLGDESDFERVLDLIEEANDGLIQMMERKS
jgi:protein-tyrosine phosphatase